MRLTEEQRQAVEEQLGGPSIEGQMVPWPDDAPKQFNACTEPCDMWNGPCACGAWHKSGK